MPVAYEFTRSDTLIRTRCVGDVTRDEVLDHFKELEADPRLPARLDVLLDLSEMESLPETGDLRSVVAAVSRIRERVVWGAIVIVAGRDVLFGMTRIFEVYAQDYFEDSCLVRDVAEAEAWLQARAAALS